MTRIEPLLVLITIGAVLAQLAMADGHNVRAPGSPERPPAPRLIVSDAQREKAMSFWLEITQLKPALRTLMGQISEQSRTTEFDLSRRGTKPEALVYYLLSLTERGRRFLKEYLPKKTKGELSLMSIDSPEGAHILKENAEHFAGQTPVAFYWMPGRKIFADFSAPIPELLTTFIHEGQHSLDESKYPKDQNVKEMQQRTLLLEHRAYRAADTLATQLIALHPDFATALRGEKKRYRPMTQEEFEEMFRDAYRYDRSWINAHFRKHPWNSFD